MALFLGLYLGHILGDFVFQPGRLVIAKRERQSAAVFHSAIVTACTALALSGVLEQAWTAVVIAGITHLGVEQLSIGARRNPKATGLTVFVLDQGLHVVSLAMIAMLSGDSVPAVLGVWPTTPEMLATVGGVTTVAFAGSILIFEVQMARADHADGPDPVLGFDLARVYGMVERAAALIAALLLSNPLLGAMAFTPRLGYAVVARSSGRTAQLAAAGVGLVITAMAWILVTSVTGL